MSISSTLHERIVTHTTAVMRVYDLALATRGSGDRESTAPSRLLGLTDLLG
jgi:hypothetical protein